MKHNLERVLLVVLCCMALSPSPTSAHHSVTAEFDPSKEFTVTGVLTHVDWTNPHIYVWVDVKGDDGQVVNWAFEGNPPGILHRAGVGKDVFKVGEVITVTAIAAKDGTKHLGFGRLYKYSDGHEVRLSIGRE
jgi:hypothetical protein